MKKVYTLFYSLNSAEKEENYLQELSEIEKNEKLLKETLNKIEFSPREGIVNKIFDFARKKGKTN